MSDLCHEITSYFLLEIKVKTHFLGCISPIFAWDLQGEVPC